MTNQSLNNHQLKQPLLTIQNLRVSFGDNPPALKDVSLTLNAGETLALVGESGSGKSVTALATLGLLPANAKVTGSVLLKDQQLVGRSESLQLVGMNEKEFRYLRGKRIAMIFQEPMTSLNP